MKNALSEFIPRATRARWRVTSVTARWGVTAAERAGVGWRGVGGATGQGCRGMGGGGGGGCGLDRGGGCNKCNYNRINTTE